MGLTTVSARSTDAARYRSSPPVSQIIGTNQAITVTSMMARPTTTVRRRRTPATVAPSQSGSSKKRMDCRTPPASPRYPAASHASVSLPRSARKAKYATVVAHSASPA